MDAAFRRLAVSRFGTVTSSTKEDIKSCRYDRAHPGAADAPGSLPGLKEVPDPIPEGTWALAQGWDQGPTYLCRRVVWAAFRYPPPPLLVHARACARIDLHLPTSRVIVLGAERHVRIVAPKAAREHAVVNGLGPALI